MTGPETREHHYPGLVARSADGQIETVLYQFLPPMLLNEYQKQQGTIESQQRAIEVLQSRLEALTRAVAALSDGKKQRRRRLARAGRRSSPGSRLP